MRESGQIVRFARVVDTLRTPDVRASESYEVGWVVVNDSGARYRIECSQGYFPIFSAKKRELAPNTYSRYESIPLAGTQICIILNAINEVSWWFDPIPVQLGWGWWNVVDLSWESEELARLFDYNNLKSDNTPSEIYVGPLSRAREIMANLLRSNTGSSGQKYVIQKLVAIGNSGHMPQWVEVTRSA